MSRWTMTAGGTVAAVCVAIVALITFAWWSTNADQRMAEELAKSVRVPGGFRLILEETYTDFAGSLRRVFIGPARGFSAGQVEVPTSFPDPSAEESDQDGTLPLRRWGFDETDCEVVLYQVTDSERLKFDLADDQKARLDNSLDVAIEITGYCP